MPIDDETTAGIWIFGGITGQKMYLAKQTEIIKFGKIRKLLTDYIRK